MKRRIPMTDETTATSPSSGSDATGVSGAAASAAANSPKPTPDARSLESLKNSIAQFEFAALSFYSSGNSPEIRQARAETVRQTVSDFKEANAPDGCPIGFHAE